MYVNAQTPGKHASILKGVAAISDAFPNLSENTMAFSFKPISVALIAAALTGLVACAATPTSEGTGQYIDDSAITTKVKTAIFNDPTLKATEINVETYKGRVQLSGFVSSQGDISHAIEVARSVSGVTSVQNDMRLK
jgi:BON domain